MTKLQIGSIILFCGFLLHMALHLGCGHGNLSSSSNVDEYFVLEILPLFEAKCFSCHGDNPDKIEGGLDMRTRAGFQKGGDNHQELIVKGRPEFSPLYQAITREDPDFSMPPKDRDALAEEEIQAVYTWIVSGAVWPDQSDIKRIASTSTAKRSRVKVKTSAGESEDWENRYYRPVDLWAYKPVEKPAIPDSTIHPIDAFIQARLQKEGLKRTERANKRDLIKRLYFDMLGLPPTPQQVEDFVSSEDDDIYQRTVNELLNSPHYGEQWARYWLDVVRYADSDGFSNDYARPSAWRYRDYVIRSFNNDKPYDQFIREQLAGDEINPEDSDHILATGFLRMGPWEHTAMSVTAETRQYYLDDVTNIVGETFLATPLTCAKCHDHKYDPIPTRDYYQIQAVFSTTQMAEREVSFLPEENMQYMSEERERVLQWLERIASEQDSLANKEEHHAKIWYRKRGLRYLPKKIRRRTAQNKEVHPPRYVGLNYADLGYRKVLQKRNQIEKRNLERFEPWAFSVYSGPFREVRSNRPMRVPAQIVEDPPVTTILKGGSIHAPTDTVLPGVLSVLHHDSLIDHTFTKLGKLPASQSGRRAALANWLTHPDNPLTARVMVNRIWQHHFGHGLARNSNNFGATGKPPTHPRLLDWLAVEFVKNDWSVKYLDRLILTSETYQQSAHHRDMKRIKMVDPDNLLMSHYPARRLAAEEIRDAMLACTNELQTEIGGIPIRPEIPLEVALQPRHTMGSVAPAYQPSPKPEMRNRRSIYIERKRAIGNPMLEVLNQNDNDISCEKRDESTVVTQAFTLLNSQSVINRAMVFADRLMQEHVDLKETIRQAHQAILLRKPTHEEIEQARTFVLNVTEDYQKTEFSAPVFPLQVEREMVEEMTGEEFSFTEYLDVYEDYQSDLNGIQTSPELRALSDYISVLFNSNEFLYVY